MSKSAQLLAMLARFGGCCLLSFGKFWGFGDLEMIM